MDTRQTLNIIDNYFDTFEIIGAESINDYATILYLMFIDEYYEFNRNISVEDTTDTEIGLTDCLVKTLNGVLECLKNNSNILQGIDLDYLPTKNHWIIPDCYYEDDEDPEDPDTPDTPEDPDIPDIPDIPDDPEDPDEFNCYIEDNILYTDYLIENNTLHTQGVITNNILQL